MNFVRRVFVGQVSIFSVRSHFGAAEQKILNNRIIASFQLSRCALKIDATFMQISDAIADVHRALHVVCNYDARHLKSLLQTADEAIDTV